MGRTHGEGIGKLVGVQALRGLAAMLVVYYHATQMVHERLDKTAGIFESGQAGVDIFFAISGFVMVVTTHRHWGRAGQWLDFLMRRLIRIVPLYWAATLLKIVATLALPALTSHPVLDPWHVTASFLFIPAWDADHRPLPLLPVGWTLNYEMLFYLLFATALAARMRTILGVSLLLCGLSLLSLLHPGAAAGQLLPALEPVAMLVNPILLEFVMGMTIGWCAVRGIRLSPRLAWLALVCGLAALAASEWLNVVMGTFSRPFYWGVPGAMLLLATVSLEAQLRKFLAGLPALLGDASYAIYLGHGFALPFVGVAMGKLGLIAPAWQPLTLLLSCVVSALAGVVVYRLFEQPLTTRFSGIWRRRRERLAGAVAEQAG